MTQPPPAKSPCDPTASSGPLRIVSGGQSGADRAALDAALEHGFPCGGWCPAGRKAEDGPIAPRYPVAALPKGGYKARTRRNVQDSDGTVIIAFGPLEGGSLSTAQACRSCRKPLLVIDAATTSPEKAAVSIVNFIASNRVSVLNIAGPRLSRQPAIYDFVYSAISSVLAKVRP